MLQRQAPYETLLQHYDHFYKMQRHVTLVIIKSL